MKMGDETKKEECGKQFGKPTPKNDLTTFCDWERRMKHLPCNNVWGSSIPKVKLFAVNPKPATSRNQRNQQPPSTPL